MLEPRIKTFPQTELIGIRTKMSYSNNLTGQIWGKFMPRRKEIVNAIEPNLYSLQNYPLDFFSSFKPTQEFEKWACVAVSSQDIVPEGMEALTIQEGLYAVFDYKGGVAGANAFFQTIFTNWLPNSVYSIDDRPHFEILGAKYKRDSEDSEEEVWIPIRLKS